MGDPSGDDARALAAEVWRRFLPTHVMAAGAPGQSGSEQIPLLAERALVDGRAAAYVCEHFACGLPVIRPEDLAAQLSA